MARRSIEKAEEKLRSKIAEAEDLQRRLRADLEATMARLTVLTEALEILRAAPEEKGDGE